MVSNNRVVATLNQVREQTINRHLHTNRVEVTNRVHPWLVMVVIKAEVGVDTKAVVTKEIVDMAAVLEGTDRVLMDKEAGAMVEEEEAVVAEEVADRVDTIVIWVMVIHQVVDSKKAKNMRQIKCLCQTLLLM